MSLWNICLARLEDELTPLQFNTWILPLHVVEDNNFIKLLAPNTFVKDWVKNHYLEKIENYIKDYNPNTPYKISLEIGTKNLSYTKQNPNKNTNLSRVIDNPPKDLTSHLNKNFTFTTFVEGKSNQLARAASLQVGLNPGKVYNPLFIYGGVGLGKTHLMHAIGNLIQETHKNSQVIYLHSEKFVAEMVKALQHGKIDEFKKHYRSVNALLIDDVQFFAGKERSQEEFFHTFNALFDSQQQIILTSDKFPKEVSGLEERLKSRFGWGLTVAIELPDLETRVAILQSKANILNIEIPSEVAFFIGKRIRSNIRELEGALRRVAANSQFTGKAITMEFVKDALRDMLAAQDKLVTMENIQKIVSEYYQIRISDLISIKRSRSIARPRQIAMTLAKELTSHSLPEIGDAFGGRDHTTVLHANRKIAELREIDPRLEEDYLNLMRILSN